MTDECQISASDNSEPIRLLSATFNDIGNAVNAIKQRATTENDGDE